MRFDLSLSQEQKQILSAAQIQFLQLLAMDNFELRQTMQAEYLENPLLEYECRSYLPSIRKGYVGDGGKCKELPAKEWPLQTLITEQLDMKKYSPKEWMAIKFLIDNLDDQGFFCADPGEMASMTGISKQTVLALLQELKRVSPRGIFTKDVRECLLMQLEDQGKPDPLMQRLVKEYWDVLSRGEVSTLAKELSVSSADIRRALDKISRLNPRPLNGLDTGSADYIIPDLLLQPNPESGKLEASLNDDWVADYRLSDVYIRMIHTTEDSQLQEYFKKKYHRAKLLIEGIEQRRQTLLAIGNYLGCVQEGFLLGKGEKVPVTMTEVAAQLQLSVSTVSRAVKGKYVQYPAGCEALKDLFATPVNTSAPVAVDYSRDAIRKELKKLIDGEDKTAPLSDAALVEKLSQMDILISRRTVAKYRESMKIPGCYDRKKY